MTIQQKSASPYQEHLCPGRRGHSQSILQNGGARPEQWQRLAALSSNLRLQVCLWQQMWAADSPLPPRSAGVKGRFVDVFTKDNVIASAQRSGKDPLMIISEKSHCFSVLTANLCLHSCLLLDFRIPLVLLLSCVLMIKSRS